MDIMAANSFFRNIRLAAALLPAAAGFCSAAEPSGAPQGPVGVSTAAAAPADSGAAPARLPPLPLDHCFCHQPHDASPDDPVPYYLARYNDLSPECSAMKAAGNSEFPRARLLQCDAFRRCWQPQLRLPEVKLALAEKISAARGEAAACCPGTEAGPGAGCDAECLKTWAEKVRALENEFNALDGAARAELDKCIAREQRAKRNREAAKPGTAEPGRK